MPITLAILKENYLKYHLFKKLPGSPVKNHLSLGQPSPDSGPDAEPSIHVPRPVPELKFIIKFSEKN